MRIRQFTTKDLRAVVMIEQAAWGPTGANEEQILSRASICPEGSVVAEHINGEIVGYAAAQRVSSLSDEPWHDLTDNGLLATTHNPMGQIAFGVGMSVLPEAARFGVSGSIIAEYARIFVQNGDCHLMALGSRLPGYARWKEQHGSSISEYLDLQRKGRSVDPELCLYQKAGFELLWPVKGYFPDPASRDWGAIISLGRQSALALGSKRVR